MIKLITILLVLLPFVFSLTFNLRPDVPETVSAEEGDFICKFTYAANGGSSEEWILDIEKYKGGYICKVGRGLQASYLYFTLFKLEVSGAEIETVEVFDNNSALLRDSDYVVKKDVMVRNHPSYQGEMNRVEIYAY